MKLALSGDNHLLIRLHFVHFSENSLILTAMVGVSATPQYIISQLVQESFLAKPGTGTEYQLLDTTGARLLAENITLSAAGIDPDTTLNVLHRTDGASLNILSYGYLNPPWVSL